MKRSRGFAIITGLLCLSLIGIGCGSVPTPDSAYPGPMPTLTPRPTNTPEPTVTPVPPVPTRPIKPTPRPTLPPTAAPSPTALPLPPSAFDALWMESRSASTFRPGSDTAVIWWADPRDIAGRREIIRFDQAITAAALSPNAQQLALILARWEQGPGPLCIVDLKGTVLHQVDADAYQVLWDRDGRSLVYLTFHGLAEHANDWLSIDQFDLATGKVTQLLPFDSYPGALTLLGWSGDGQKLYYQRRASYGKYELWVLEPKGQRNYQINSLDLGEDPLYPPLALSPDGSKLLIHTSQELSWMSVDERTRHNIETPARSIHWLCGEFWAPASKPNQVVICYIDDAQPTEHLLLLDLQSPVRSELSVFARRSSDGAAYRPLTISPDETWAIIEGASWVHLATGMRIYVRGPSRFIAWIPRGNGQ